MINYSLSWCGVVRVAGNLQTQTYFLQALLSTENNVCEDKRQLEIRLRSQATQLVVWIWILVSLRGPKRAAKVKPRKEWRVRRKREKPLARLLGLLFVRPSVDENFGLVETDKDVSEKF